MQFLLRRMWLKLRRLQLVRKWLCDMRVSWLRRRVRIVLNQLLLPCVLLALVRRKALKHQPACPVECADVPLAFDLIRRVASRGGFAQADFRFTNAAGGFTKSDSETDQRRSSRGELARAPEQGPQLLLISQDSSDRSVNASEWKPTVPPEPAPMISRSLAGRAATSFAINAAKKNVLRTSGETQMVY